MHVRRLTPLDAQAFYGFRPCAPEPAARRVDGEPYDELQRFLPLPAG